MKAKSVKSITSYLLFACALACLVAVIAVGTSAPARAAADGRVCSVGTLKGLYLATLDGYANIGGTLVPKTVMEGKRFNGDGTFSNDFGTVNIGGTTILNTGGFGGTYTVHGTARARSQSPTVQALICTSDRVHRSFGLPRLRED